VGFGRAGQLHAGCRFDFIDFRREVGDTEFCCDCGRHDVGERIVPATNAPKKWNRNHAVDGGQVDLPETFVCRVRGIVQLPRCVATHNSNLVSCRRVGRVFGAVNQVTDMCSTSGRMIGVGVLVRINIDDPGRPLGRSTRF